MHPFAWVTAQTVADAAAAVSTTVADAMTLAPEATGSRQVAVVKAGGVDVLDLLKEKLLVAGTLVSLREIPGLDHVAEGPEGGLHIGPMVTLAALAIHPLVQQRYPALAETVRSSASPQLRNVATVGGNLLQRPRCWYFRAAEFRCLRKGGEYCFAISGENQYHAIFDNDRCAIVHPSTAATVLVALGAIVELTDADGTVRRMLLEDFLVSPKRDLHRENDLQPQEILTGIYLPALSAATRVAHTRQGERESFDWPLGDVAVLLELLPDGTCARAAVVLGAAAPVPHRARAAERFLIGRSIDEDLAREAGRAALEGATPLSKNAYKLPLFEALVRRTVLKAAVRV
jgi:xanthine dehydrogenase YagS FAD-binding subunit